MSDDVVVGETGACLDIAAEPVDVPDSAAILVLSCRTGAGQHWTL
jgi:hypothetical protein